MASINSYQSYIEIHQQYEQLTQTYDYMMRHKNKVTDFFKDADDVVFIACGSSYWMSLSAHKTFALKTGKRAFAIKAGDVVLCPDEYRRVYQNPVFVCPSRSGATGEVNDAVELMKSFYPGAKILSIIEYSDSRLEKVSDLTFHLDWANETSVCQTRSFSNLYLASLMIAAFLGNDATLLENMQQYLACAPELCRQHEQIIRNIVDTQEIKNVVALGIGRQYGVVIEGAYIIIEMAEFASNYYQLLEYRHGPVVTAHPGTLVFICSGRDTTAHEAKMAEEIRKTGAMVFAVSEKEESYADITFCMDGVFEKELIALHFVFVMQSFAHFFSIARGCDPDHPGDLIPYIMYQGAQ